MSERLSEAGPATLEVPPPAPEIPPTTTTLEAVTAQFPAPASPTNPSLPVRKSASGTPWTTRFAVAAVIVAAFYAAWRALMVDGVSTSDTLTAAVAFGSMDIVVTAKGSLESSKTVDGVCEVSGHQNKIVFIVPEGSKVKKGNEVVKFDSKDIDKSISEQQIKWSQAKAKIDSTTQEAKVQENKSESEVMAADLEHTLAKLDFKKYQKGDYLADVADMQGKIAADKFQAEESRQKVEQFRILVKKGFRTDEQLRGLEEDAKQWEFNLQRDLQKLEILKTYEYERKSTEFKAKVDQAAKKVIRSKDDAVAQNTKFKGDVDAAKSTASMEKRQLDDLQEQRKKCTIFAEQDGVVAYANMEWWDDSRRIREGAMVYFRQTVFTLPDMSQMQVKANVHEAVVKKVKVGQKVEIRVEAFPSLVIPGKVSQVALLADSANSWRRGNIKEYPIKVVIDKMPDVPLKPGMSAEIVIHVQTIEEATSAPIQAVVERESKRYAYVEKAGGFERREVTIGENNARTVQILTGLKAGERVALDARKRLDRDFGDKSDQKPAEEPAPAKGKK